MPRLLSPNFRLLGAGLVFLAQVNLAPAQGDRSAQLDEILAQNRSLLDQVQQQQKQINELRQRLDELKAPAVQPVATAPTPRAEPAAFVPVENTLLRSAREIRVSGEVGLAFFSTGAKGAFPNSEFRVDDAKLFLESPVWKNVYVFTGLNLVTREAEDEYFEVGELYADVEDLFVAGRDQRLSLRIGRFNIPFGEEYQYRDVMNNPLIAHSVADLWGTDSGIQIYGTFGQFRYNLAVQNGGDQALRDYHKDKSVTARIGFAPTKSLSVSASGHRTGKLDTVNDFFSNIWFGGGFFGALGPKATTPTFQAELLEFDANWQWKTGHLKSTAGFVKFSDANTAGDDSRRMNYFSLEAVQQIDERFYGAARYSEVRAPGGYPLVGHGNFGQYYFGPRTENLHRMTLGLGYRFADPLVWKLDYSWEDGRLSNGKRRQQEDMLATEIGLKF